MPAIALRALLLLACIAATACDVLTDGATRIASQIERGADRLGSGEGARYTIDDATPASGRDCAGPYTAQLDKVGALIVWCKDAAGATVSSHSTSYHARFVDTERTFIVDKPAGSHLAIELERRGGRATIVAVR
ncbi:MAG TPA: hypothetical protein VEG27_10975 [Usitatibacter sp.]|nr:hypothetical protein [Usitatibacter sp.]